MTGEQGAWQWHGTGIMASEANAERGNLIVATEIASSLRSSQ